VGAHVSVTPNHQTHRVASMATRSLMALSGTFGYELDLLTLSLEEQMQVVEYVSLHARIEEVVRTGRMYRLLSPFNSNLCSWMFVSEDQTRALVFAFNTQYYEVTWNYPRLRLRGLRQEAHYTIEQHGSIARKVLTGRTLESAGLPILFNGDAESFLFILTQN